MKPGVFSQLYTHLVFAVKYRERLLKKEFRPEVYSYISGIITNRKHKSIIVNGMLDHVHIFVGLDPNEKISDLVGIIKKSSSTFINEKYWFRGKFQWQDGYGAFSYGRSQLDNVYNYIKNQGIHHNLTSTRLTQYNPHKILVWITSIVGHSGFIPACPYFMWGISLVVYKMFAYLI